MSTLSDILEQYEEGTAPVWSVQCKTCTIPDDVPNASQVRVQIARQYLGGVGIRAIYRGILPLMKGWPPGVGGPRISRAGLYRHLTTHLDSLIKSMRTEAHLQALRAGIDLETFNGRYVDGVTLIRKLSVLVDDAIASGRMKITANDGVRVALAEHALAMEQEAMGDVAQILADSRWVADALDEVLTPPQKEQLFALVSARKEAASQPNLRIVPALEAAPIEVEAKEVKTKTAPKRKRKPKPDQDEDEG